MSDPARDADFGVYVHWPYCAAICPYCAFNVFRDRGEDRAALVDALVADIQGWRDRAGPRRARSLYFGGGTPSRMDPRDVARIVAAVDAAWPLEAGAEITLETNPDDADADRLAAFRDAGVNRLSLGVQALDDRALADLGRWHSAADARAAAERAARVFGRVSIDLISMRPGQTVEAWTAELREALALGVEHASIYELTIEPGTAFERRQRRGTVPQADDARGAAFFEATNAVCAEAGFEAYEISNFARRPDARSAHNLVYWRSSDWAAIGPGAHGRFIDAAGARRATEAAARPDAYAAQVREMGWGVETDETLDAVAQLEETLLMGLRLVEGVPLARISGVDADRLAALIAEGWLETRDDRLRATERGRGVVDRLVLELASGE